MFPKILYDGIWHTTSLQRFQQILNTGYILPEPSIPDTERWNTRIGSDGYPFVRSIGGVSLFDFSDFNEEKYEKKYPLSSWHTFVPCNPSWESSVWIKMNKAKILDGLICPKDLLSLWKSKEAYRRNIMPMIEAAHIGSIPISNFESVLFFDKKSKKFSKLSLDK